MRDMQGCLLTKASQSTDIALYLLSPSLSFFIVLNFLGQCFGLLHGGAGSSKDTTPPATSRTLSLRCWRSDRPFLGLRFYFIVCGWGEASMEGS